jgi:2-keto-4-pentenoate hydratase/2-oxohepta-3-ene-1,7-dioic acid hydratase in catechol pathway
VSQLRGAVRINDQQVCATTTAGMQHTIADALVHVSRSERLHPAEVFGLGTLPGGCGMENGHWLKRGDRIELIIEGVGSLGNTIA